MSDLATTVATKVNGESVTVDIPNRLTLAEFLRDVLGLTGTKVSCELEVCGVCTVLVDNEPVSSCTFLATQIDGREVTTIEGLADGRNLHPIQQAFLDKFGLQCGFCTPGFIMMAKALIDENPNPDEEQIKHHLDGNICRCTGYRPIIDAVQLAAQRMQEAKDA